MALFKTIFKSEDGYGTVEYLVIFLSSAVLASVVVASILPNLRELYSTMVGNFKDISGSGF